MKIKLTSNNKYSICSCGLSKKLPYCDNTHREYNQNNSTNYKSVKIIPSKNVEVEIISSTWKEDDKEI